MTGRTTTLGLVLALIGACTAQGVEPTSSTGALAAAMSCKPAEVRSCPCATGGVGQQVCAASGLSLGPCTACPAASTATSPLGQAGGLGLTAAGAAGRSGAGGGMTVNAGTGAPAGGASAGARGGQGAAGAGGAFGSAGGAAGAPGAGRAAAGGRPTPLPAERGVTCGVGLPTQCDPDAEKCCKRSLATDSCIPKADSCKCDAMSCTVITVSCDGPEDCVQGQVCCAAGSSRTLGDFACATRCGASTQQACHVKTDCTGSLVCAISSQMASISVCTDPQSLKQ